MAIGNLIMSKQSLTKALSKVRLFGNKQIVYSFERDRCVTTYGKNTERVLAFLTPSGQYRPTLYGLNMMFTSKESKREAC